nr:MAG TPA: hypothetical protein [Caudoviricetes sp.]
MLNYHAVAVQAIGLHLVVPDISGMLILLYFPNSTN